MMYGLIISSTVSHDLSQIKAHGCQINNQIKPVLLHRKALNVKYLYSFSSEFFLNKINLGTPPCTFQAWTLARLRQKIPDLAGCMCKIVLIAW